MPPESQNLRFEYHFRVSGAGEEPMDFDGSSELPLALKFDFLRSTELAFPELLEILVSKPMVMSVTVFLRERYDRLRKEIARNQAVSSTKGSVLPKADAALDLASRFPLIPEIDRAVESEPQLPKMPFIDEDPPQPSVFPQHGADVERAQRAKTPKSFLVPLPDEKGVKRVA